VRPSFATIVVFVSPGAGTGDCGNMPAFSTLNGNYPAVTLTNQDRRRRAVRLSRRRETRRPACSQVEASAHLLKRQCLAGEARSERIESR
jgi:hypothetical protein